MELVFIVGAFFLHRRPGHLYHEGFQGMGAQRAPPTLTLTGALIVAGAKSAPGGKGVAALKIRQTGANLRQDAGRGHLTDTGHDLQPLPQLLVRAQLFLQADQHLSQLPFQLPDAPKKQAELKAVMGREEAADGASQFLGLLSPRPASVSLQVQTGPLSHPGGPAAPRSVDPWSRRC